MKGFEPSWKQSFTAEAFVRAANSTLESQDYTRGIRVVAARITRGDQIAVTGAYRVSRTSMTALAHSVQWGLVVSRALGVPEVLFMLPVSPSGKWSKVRISGVPTGKSGSRDAFSPVELLASLREASPHTRDLDIRQNPRWIRRPELYGPGEVSSFSFAFEDPDGELLKKLCRAPVFVAGVRARASRWKEKAKPRAPAPAKPSARASAPPTPAAPSAQAPPPPPVQTQPTPPLPSASASRAPPPPPATPVAPAPRTPSPDTASASQLKRDAEASPVGAKRPSKKKRDREQARAFREWDARAAALS
jgi:hypothetical protein